MFYRAILDLLMNCKYQRSVMLPEGNSLWALKGSDISTEDGYKSDVQPIRGIALSFAAGKQGAAVVHGCTGITTGFDAMIVGVQLTPRQVRTRAGGWLALTSSVAAQVWECGICTV